MADHSCLYLEVTLWSRGWTLCLAIGRETEAQLPMALHSTWLKRGVKQIDIISL